MTRFLTIRSILTGLALLGLVLSPLARPAMAVDSGGTMQGDIAAHGAMDMGNMSCCPDQVPMPDCGKDCPFMAVCATQFLSAMPQATGFLIPPRRASLVVADNDVVPSGLTQRPPPKPPKL